MDEICEEIFVQSRDVREFFNRTIPVITSLHHDGPFLPEATAWSSHPVPPPDTKTALIEGKLHPPPNLPLTLSRSLPTRTCPPHKRNPSRNLPHPRVLQLQHGLRHLRLPRRPLAHQRNRNVLAHRNHHCPCWRVTTVE